MPFIGFEGDAENRRHVDRALEGAGFQFDVVMELRSLQSILRMVALDLEREPAYETRLDPIRPTEVSSTRNAGAARQCQASRVRPLRRVPSWRAGSR